MRFALMAFAAVSVSLFALGATAEVPDQPTFTKDILPILQESCQDCHRPYTHGTGGMVAPMSLMTYEEVRPWSKAIARAMDDQYMPPWFATEEFHGVFHNERALDRETIDTVKRWVETGAKRGNPSDAPAAKTWPDSEWWNGEPDLIVQLPEPLWVGDDVEDWQPNIDIELTEEMLPEDKWIQGLEAQPDSEVVHHVVVYKKDAADPSRAARNSGFRDVNIGGLAPGAENPLLREGFGIPLEKGTTLRINMHYHKEAGPGTGTYDQSRVGIYFNDDPDADLRELVIEPVGSFDFEIPPGHDSWTVGMAKVFDQPFTVLSYLPHMHLRGTAAEYWAYLPDGTSEKLLDIPEYDYNWQLNYRYGDLREFPAGTRIEVKMKFDNSVENVSNPDPSKAIRFGLETSDEMALGWMTYAWNEEASTD